MMCLYASHGCFSLGHAMFQIFEQLHGYVEVGFPAHGLPSPTHEWASHPG